MNPQELVQDIDRLVALPEVCMKVNRLMERPDYSAFQVSELIAQDTDLSARLLRLVNSPFFGLRVRVDNISRAVALVGTQDLRNLMFATTVARAFQGIPEDLVSMTVFWRHAVTTALLAQTLAERCHVLHPERLFVAGMLHDIGRLVIYLALPEQARAVLERTGGDDWVLADAERKLLGFTHMEVGAALLRKWGLPANLVAVAECHHRPAAAGEHQLDAALVHIALAVANGERVGLDVEEMLWAIDPAAWSVTGLDQEAVKPLVEGMLARAAEVMSLLLAPPAADRRRAGQRP